MTPAVSLRGVTFTYPAAREPALVDVTVDIPEGSFVIVAGKTGSGKSTLLRSLNGLVPQFSGGTFEGRVTLGGRDTLERAPRELADVVAFVPQDPDASFVLDRVEDELAYAMENLGMDPAVMRRRLEETLDLMNIVHLRDRSVRDLSGGERQRVAIGAALTPGARILLLDEPTSQLDPQGAEDVLAALQRLVHDLGLTVVAAEHRLERIAGFADLAIGCSEGRVEIGEPGGILERVGAGPPVARLGRLVGWVPPPLTVRDARRKAAEMRLPPPPQVMAVRREEELLRAANLRAGYGRTEVLHGLDLAVASGEIVALVGRNGAGKTTLLRCLTGIHRAPGGSVTVNGIPPRAGRNVAFCPQGPDAILFADTVEDEIRATLAASDGDDAARRWLHDMGIEELSGSHPREVSAGQRVLVAIAAIAATGAPLLLLDEPTRGLDREAKDKLAALLRDWARTRGATLFATHDVELVARVATRVVVLAAGEIVADGPPADVLSDSPVFSPQMTRVFGRGWLTPEQVAGALAAAERSS